MTLDQRFVRGLTGNTCKNHPRSGDLGRGWAQKTSLLRVWCRWMAETSWLNCLFCRIPYQSLHSLNALPSFSEKALLFTSFCFVASPSPNSTPTPPHTPNPTPKEICWHVYKSITYQMFSKWWPTPSPEISWCDWQAVMQWVCCTHKSCRAGDAQILWLMCLRQLDPMEILNLSTRKRSSRTSAWSPCKCVWEKNHRYEWFCLFLQEIIWTKVAPPQKNWKNALQPVPLRRFDFPARWYFVEWPGHFKSKKLQKKNISRLFILTCFRGHLSRGF